MFDEPLAVHFIAVLAKERAMVMYLHLHAFLNHVYYFSKTVNNSSANHHQLRFVTSFYDDGKRDGVKKVVFGAGLKFWMFR